MKEKAQCQPQLGDKHCVVLQDSLGGLWTSTTKQTPAKSDKGGEGGSPFFGSPCLGHF